MENILEAIKRVPSLSNVPDNMIIAGIALFAIFVVFFLIVLVFSSFDFSRPGSGEQVPHDSHKLIMDLQKTLIQEMKGTSKQNQLMINLTIIFIVITLIGMAVTIAGGPTILKYFDKTIKTVPSVVEKIKVPAVAAKSKVPIVVKSKVPAHVKIKAPAVR